MRWHAAFLLSLVALGPSCGFAANAAKTVTHSALPEVRATENEELIYKIDSVSAAVENHRLVIRAKGAVRSGGWTNPKLHVHTGLPPGQHMLVVEFMGVPPAPETAVIQALLPVEAIFAARLPRSGIVAVQVISQTNNITTQILH